MSGFAGFMVDFEISENAKAYSQEYGLTITERFGWGMQGTVYKTDARSAMKVFEREDAYLRERDVYRRLLGLRVTKVRECNIPELLNYNNRHLVIEMTIVQPAFVVDFASAYLNRKPDFSEEVLAEKTLEASELFGADWHEVELIVASFERFGIFIVDIHPRNIRLK